MPTKTLTTAEAVELLQEGGLDVSPQTLRRLADAGELRAIRLTPRSPRWFRAEDVEQLLQRSGVAVA